MRKALISCFLIVCFEMYHGNQFLAVAQARTGVKLLPEWLRELAGPTRLSFTSPRPQTVEDELICAYSRLYKAIMIFRDPQPIFFDSLLVDNAVVSLTNMPSTFFTVGEATYYMEFYLRCVLHWNSTPEHDSLTAESYAKIIPDIILNHEPRSTQDSPSTVELMKQMVFHQHNYARWNAAFRPVWERSRLPSGISDRAGAAHLRM